MPNGSRMDGPRTCYHFSLVSRASKASGGLFERASSRRQTTARTIERTAEIMSRGRERRPTSKAALPVVANSSRPRPGRCATPHGRLAINRHWLAGGAIGGDNKWRPVRVARVACEVCRVPGTSLWVVCKDVLQQQPDAPPQAGGRRGTARLEPSQGGDRNCWPSIASLDCAERAVTCSYLATCRPLTRACSTFYFRRTLLHNSKAGHASDATAESSKYCLSLFNIRRQLEAKPSSRGKRPK